MNGWPETARPSDLAKLVAAAQGPRATASSHSGIDQVGAEPHIPEAHERGSDASQAEPGECAVEVNIREWTKAIGRGDEAAFARFYDRYSMRLYRYLLVVAKGNETEASEVLQTVIIKLAK